MKSFRIIPVLMISVLVFTGCDFFRSIVGKPTSKEIEKMKQESLAKIKKQRELDSLKLVNERIARERLEEEQRNSLENKGRYHVIIGAYRDYANADRMFSTLEKDGYSPYFVNFSNGLRGVSVVACQDLRKALGEADRLLEHTYCPDDIWVYDIKQNIHINR